MYLLSMEDIYLILYSHSQDCYHTERLSEAVQINLEAMHTDERNDYLVIGYAKDRREAAVAEEALRNLFPHRGSGKGPGNMKISEF